LARAALLAVASLCGLGTALSAVAETYVLSKDSSVIGELKHIRARHEDTFSDIARRYNIGFNELVLANPTVDPWLPQEGTEIVVPSLYVLPNAPHEGIVLNLPEMRLYYYPKPKAGEPAVVVTYPASIGRMEWNTPLGKTKVVKKTENPVWIPPESVRAEHAADGNPLPKVVAAGPDNPLGTHALRLGIPGYLIHGTDRPYGIGMRVTHGCVRLYPEDIRTLFSQVPVGTAVYLVNEPFKAGWRDGVLYFEVHPPLEEDAEQLKSNRTPAVKAVVEASPEGQSVAVDWEQVLELSTLAHGIPVPLIQKKGAAAAAALQPVAYRPTGKM
jgi:L,D-transpeptidase ErfK/SrfK